MFKNYLGPSLTVEQVLTELEKIQDLGWDIYTDDTEYTYLIIPDDSKKIYIQFLAKQWYISSIKNGVTKFTDIPHNLDTFIEILGKAAKSVEINLELNKPVDTYRLIQKEPASNKSKFIDLINKRAVKDIFDPYFDTNSIRTLLSLSKLGLKFNNPIRCLTTKKTSGKIDKPFWTDFNNELSLTLEIRICQSKKEHRRFLILSDDKIIIIGCSLNDINKNEILMEDTSQEDIDFFSEEWKNGSNCT